MEGFIDPLTGKPRHIPLEIVRLQNDNSYILQKKADIIYSSSFSPKSVSESDLEGTSILNFNIPGLIAMNHPDQFPNSASSEFFAVPDNLREDDITKLINGRYAPFAYVVGGYSVLQSLKPGDVISGNKVDEFGLNNLKKIKGSSIADLMGGDYEE